MGKNIINDEIKELNYGKKTAPIFLIIIFRPENFTLEYTACFWCPKSDWIEIWDFFWGRDVKRLFMGIGNVK